MGNMAEMGGVSLGRAEGEIRKTELSGKKGISGSTLKMIAIIAMFIDHTGAIVVARMLLSGMGQVGPIPVDGTLYRMYQALRLIGRLGFPIFCYLLIEGFWHTRDVKKYAGRLFLFALISEIPFDLGFTGNFFYWGYQNVFFTLFIGLLVIAGFRFAEGKREWNASLRVVFCALVLGAGAGVAVLLQTDYNAVGVLTIAVMYLFRRSRVLAAGLGCAVLTAMQTVEVSSFFILIPVHMYNGRRGWNMKWFFYAFYPLHILLLYVVAYAMGLGQIRMMI